jgi:IS30 family transposase
MAHHHFTRDDRVLLARLTLHGLSARSIARILGFHPSSIYRELQRGASPAVATGYSVKRARQHAKLARTRANQQHRKLFAAQARQLTALLREYYSPEQAGTATGLSHSTVYRWLWSQSKAFLTGIRQYLRHPKLRRCYGTKRREKQRELLKKRWIDERPQTVNDRLFFGHWEGDTVHGNKHSGYLVTLVERKSGYALVGHIPKVTKAQFRHCVEELFAPLPSHLKRSLTLDNGSEMQDYEVLEKHTGMPIYFAHPYHSWERGSNENFNGLLRQFFPKNRDFRTITKQELDLTVKLLNTRPRKRHGYQSPCELLKPYLAVAI